MFTLADAKGGVVLAIPGNAVFIEEFDQQRRPEEGDGARDKAVADGDAKEFE